MTLQKCTQGLEVELCELRQGHKTELMKLMQSRDTRLKIILGSVQASTKVIWTLEIKQKALEHEVTCARKSNSILPKSVLLLIVEKEALVERVEASQELNSSKTRYQQLSSEYEILPKK
jgi:hypothetical protein